MEISLLIFWLLLLGAAICTVITRLRLTIVWPTAAGLTALSLLIWFTGRSKLPVNIIFVGWSSSGFLPDWTWRIDASVWALTAWLLLLLTAVFLHTALSPHSAKNKTLSPAALLVLTAAALTAIWSNSFVGLLAGLTLLLSLWLITVWAAGETSNAFLLKGTVLLLGLLLAWPIGSSRTALLAAALLLNIWPLPLWQPHAHAPGTAVVTLTPLLPPLAGGLLLLRLLPVAELSPGVSLLLTVLALVGFMQGIRLAWGRLHLPSYAVSALMLAQAHLLLLAALWVGSSGVVAELRVLLLAGGTLFLIVAQPTKLRWLRFIVGGLALAALAGLPLTASFASRASLYANWLADGRWALILVLALLHVPLIIIGLWLLLAKPVDHDEKSISKQEWAREAAALLPALGLISVGNVTWTEIPLAAWLAILAAAIVGLLLPRFLDDAQQVRVTLRQALGAERPFPQRLPTLKQLAIGVQTAVNDAAAILDGDSGLLWVLLLAIIIILAN